MKRYLALRFIFDLATPVYFWDIRPHLSKGPCLSRPSQTPCLSPTFLLFFFFLVFFDDDGYESRYSSHLFLERRTTTTMFSSKIHTPETERELTRKVKCRAYRGQDFHDSLFVGSQWVRWQYFADSLVSLYPQSRVL